MILPGGTTELGPIMHPLSSFEPSKIIDLNPTETSSSIVQLYKVHPL
jgi:hypothetical protein